MKTKIIIGIACLFASIAMRAAVGVTDLRVEQLREPVGIDAAAPRLSWKIASDKTNVMQNAYHIIVASTQELLDNNTGDLWDSGKVMSDQSHLVAYKGDMLRSNQKCYWKVKSWTTAGETQWSETKNWVMGLLGETHWRGQWIGMDAAAPWDSETQWSRLSARYLRKEFQAGKPVKRATLHICGLGLYELFLNGQRVGDQVLAPAPTDYRKTVLYNTHDVTALIGKETNAIGVTLGNGRFYTMRQNYKPYKIPQFGYPKLRLNLIIEYTDGTQQTIVSDTTWKLTANGPIRSNNEYDGEEYDARKELGQWSRPGYDDSKWTPAQRVAIPDGTLRAASSPNMKVVKTLKPVDIRKSGGQYIIDTGQNLAGWMRIRVKGEAGDTIRMRFAEHLDENGMLEVRNLRDARVTDIYVANGKEAKGTTWAPRFVYHGFRYVELTGYPDPKAEDFQFEVVSDDVRTMGTFQSSNETLNTIHQNAWWGVLSNYKGMPVDCPQRNERQPWLGDHAMGSWGESYLFDSGNLFAKWMDDIRDAQREDGCIPDVVPPYFNYYSDNMTWPATFLIVSDMLHTQYGNDQPIRRNYPAMKKWLLHMLGEYINEDYTINRDKYGDWCVPPESLELIHSRDPNRKTDGALIATAYACRMLELMTRFAELQDLDDDANRWKMTRNRMKEAFNNRFLKVKTGTSPVPGHILYPDSVFYDNNTVTANILPLAFDLVPEEHRKAVEDNVIVTIITTNNGHISTGVIGTQWLMRQLSQMGRADVAYLLATNRTYPSWGYMAQQGATTIWELWNGNTANPTMNSANHVMLLGDLIGWMYQNLGGIRSSVEKPGFKHIIFRPDFDIQELSRVNVTYETPYGTAISYWKKTPTHLQWAITVPHNTTAEVHLPDGRTLSVGSGTHRYDVAIPTRDPHILTDEFLYEKASFPECHGATIAETPEGDLIASFFGGTKERNPDCMIWVCRKEKGSDEWTAPVAVADGVIDGVKKACWNPVLFQLPNGGDLMLFYKVGEKVSDWTGHVVRSSDGGRTWGTSEALPDGLLGPVKNKPEYLAHIGRIISPSSTEGSGGWRIHFELSDDLGRTWRKVGPIAADSAVLTARQVPGHPELGPRAPIYAIQPSILRHKDGSLQAVGRTRNGQIFTTTSRDNGETWSNLTLTSAPNNNSGTDAVTLDDGSHLLVLNPFRTIPGTPKGPRTPLDVYRSDDGIEWKAWLRLEDSPISQYSYPSVIKGDDGTVHVIYTWRRQRIKYVKINP